MTTQQRIIEILESTLSRHIKEILCLGIVASALVDQNCYVWGENYKSQKPYLDLEDSRYKINQIAIEEDQIKIKTITSFISLGLRNSDWRLQLNQILLK